MTEPRPQETQQELFVEFSTEPKKVERLPSFAKAQKPILVSTNVEQLILAGIVLILFSCFVFFLGVLRGRSLGAAEPRAASVPVAPAALQQQARGQRGEIDPARLQSVKRALEKEKALTAAPAPQAPSRAGVAAKPYTIQLATFKKRDMAEREVAALRRNGFQATLTASGDYYEVCVGQYASIADAKKDLKLFGSRYKDRFLRRR